MNERIGTLVRNGKTIYYAHLDQDGYAESPNLSDVEYWLMCDRLKAERAAKGVALQNAIKTAFADTFGPDVNYLSEQGSWFIEGYRAALRAARGATQNLPIDTNGAGC